MEEEEKTQFVHIPGFREREGFANETREALAKDIVPALDMRCLASFFAAGKMLVLGDDSGIGLPEVGEAAALAVAGW